MQPEPAIRAMLPGGEALFGAGLVCPDVLGSLAGLGLELSDLTEVNFVTRSAPLGPVPTSVVHAVFYNFHPSAIAAVIPAAWSLASPGDILVAQASAFDRPLADALAVVDRRDLAELAGLAREAAQVAAAHPEGRPLFAALCELDWPEGDHLVLWHAAKLLREYRGDAHVACLVTESLSGLEALIVHEAFEPAMEPGILRRMRRWSSDDWAAAVDRLRGRGWLTPADPPALTERGRERRQAIEDRTNELAWTAYTSIGVTGFDRMRSIGSAIAPAMRAAGLGLSDHVRRFAEPVALRTGEL